MEIFILKEVIEVVINIVIIIVVWFFLFKSDEKESKMSYKDVDFKETYIENLTKKELLKWFKRDEILEQLKNNKNITAIIIKGNHDIAKKMYIKNKNSLIQIIWNEKENSIIDGQVLNGKSISSEVLNMFGDKNMILIS